MATIQKIRHQENTDRAARTRTLIQLGGLLTLLDLPEICGITLGEDLQIDPVAQDKAALLLGLLTDAISHIPPHLTPDQKSAFTKKGINRLKQHAYKRV